MRILLINPPLQSLYHKVGFTLPPLGLLYLGGILRQSGHYVKIVDLNLKNQNPFAEKWDAVGITADTPRYDYSIKFAKQAKDNEAIVIMGGPHVTFLFEEALMSGYVDFIVKGEGESILPVLINSIEKGVSPDDIKGICYSRNGEIIENPDIEPVMNLDSLPFPARDLLPMKEYNKLMLAKRPVTSLITSRGCPYDCNFCASSRFNGSRWRTRGIKNIIEELGILIDDYGFKAIAFLDDNFTLDPARVIEICESIISNKWDIKWWCFSRPDSIIRHPEMIKAMSSSGARYVFLGIESPHQKVLEYYNKKEKTSEAEQAVRLLKDYGIDTMASFIIGGFDETREMILQTLKYAKRLNPGSAQFSIMTPYPGTRLYEMVKEHIITDDWNKYDCLHAVLKTQHLNPVELEKLLYKGYRSFYIRPSRLLEGILSALRGKGVRITTIYNLIKGVQN